MKWSQPAMHPSRRAYCHHQTQFIRTRTGSEPPRGRGSLSFPCCVFLTFESTAEGAGCSLVIFPGGSITCPRLSLCELSSLNPSPLCLGDCQELTRVWEGVQGAGMCRQTWAGRVEPTQAPGHMGWEGLDTCSSAHSTLGGHQRSPRRCFPNDWNCALQNINAKSLQKPPEEKEYPSKWHRIFQGQSQKAPSMTSRRGDPPPIT